ncbi:hypothetical protein CBL_09988 [Carabus blaptoides fortunei]
MFIAKWSKINENYLLICENCTANLQIAYDFIRMCNKNSNRMQAYVMFDMQKELFTSIYIKKTHCYS